MAPAKVPTALAELQRRANRATADAWEIFSPHRARVTALAAAAGGGRLCVLGAGNGNDLDFDALAARFGQLHLVDLDDRALARAAARVGVQTRDALVLHAPVDLTGALARLDRWAAGLVGAKALEALPASAAAAVVAALPGPFDVVLSAGLLSQILHAAGRALGTGHPQLRAVSGALVAAHLRSMAQLLRPGGMALLVTDVVSSETYPLEELWTEQAPQALLDQLVRAGNVFTGTDPAFVGRLLASHPDVAPFVTNVTFEEPWLWTLSHELTVMAYAIRFQARARTLGGG